MFRVREASRFAVSRKGGPRSIGGTFRTSWRRGPQCVRELHAPASELIFLTLSCSRERALGGRRGP